MHRLDEQTPTRNWNSWERVPMQQCIKELAGMALHSEALLIRSDPLVEQ